MRVNKVKHYQMIAQGGYNTEREDIDLSPVIDDETDNDHSEFLLNPDTIGFENIKCMCLVANAKENAYEQLRLTTPPIIADDRVLEKMVENRKIYPNDPCPCGSEKKYKRCHGR